MNKDEILKKARSENPDGNKDEREVFIYDKSFYWTFLAMGLTALILLCAKISRDQSITDISAMVQASAFGGFMYRFVKTRKPVILVLSLIFLVSAISCMVGFFMGR